MKHLAFQPIAVIGLLVVTAAAGAGDADKHIVFTEDAVDTSAGGLAAFKIETPTATYFLEKSGAGLSSLIDKQGNDWLSFDPERGSGAAGEYRGFPNAVHRQAGNYFHPRNQATDPAMTAVESVAANCVTITAVSSNRLWACRYEFFPTHCTFTMTRMPAGKKYWVLYEGTPGGQFDDQDWWVSSGDRERRALTQNQSRDLPSPAWIGFGDKRLNRTLFLVHHQDDRHPDRYYPMKKQMTVFGFGRQGTTKFLDTTGQQFSIGLVESSKYQEIQRRVMQIVGGER